MLAHARSCACLCIIRRPGPLPFSIVWTLWHDEIMMKVDYSFRDSWRLERLVSSKYGILFNIRYTIRSIVCEECGASCHTVSWSLDDSVNKSLGHLVTWSVGHLMTRSISHSGTWSHCQLVTQWLGQSVTWALGQLVTWSLGHSVTRSHCHYISFNITTNWLTD